MNDIIVKVSEAAWHEILSDHEILIDESTGNPPVFTTTEILKFEEIFAQMLVHEVAKVANGLHKFVGKDEDITKLICGAFGYFDDNPS